MRASVLSEPTVLRALAAAGREMSKGCLPPLSILLNPAYKEPVARLVAASVGPVGTARRASARGQEPGRARPDIGEGTGEHQESGIRGPGGGAGRRIRLGGGREGQAPGARERQARE